MSTLNSLLDSFSLRANGEISWSTVKTLVQSEPRQVDDRTLLHLVTVGFFEDEAREWDPCGTSASVNQLTSDILISVLELVTAPQKVEDPQDVFIHAFLHNGISTCVFETLITYRKKTQCPTMSTLDQTWWHGYSEEELLDGYDLRDYPWPIEKLDVLLRGFSDSIHVILYKAIETNQSLQVIQHILFFNIAFPKGFIPKDITEFSWGKVDTLLNVRQRLLKKVSLADCGHCSNFCNCALQALIFKSRFDVWRLLIEKSTSGSLQSPRYGRFQALPFIQKEDVCRLSLLHVLTRFDRSSLCAGSHLHARTKRKQNALALDLASDLIKLDPMCLSQVQFDHLPIHWVCTQENSNLIKLLIQKSIQHNIGSKDYRGGILMEISNGQYNKENALQKLLCNNKLIPKERKDMITFLLDPNQPLLLPSDVHDFNLLHVVIQKNKESDAAQAILQLEPAALKTRNSFGDLPIHSTVTPFPPLEEDEILDSFNSDYYIKPHMLELLLLEGMKSNDNSHLNMGGLLETNSKGQTVLDILVHYWVEFRHSSSVEKTFWQCVDMIRRVVSPQIPLLQAIIRKISPFEVDRLEEAIHRCDCTEVCDHSGNLPLHVAIINKDRIGLNGLRAVLEANPTVARIRDHQNRLPLHMALSGDVHFKWEDGIKDIFEAHKSAIDEIDAVTKVYPFILTTLTKKSGDLDSIYNLIQESPHIMSQCHESRRLCISKRKACEMNKAAYSHKKAKNLVNNTME